MMTTENLLEKSGEGNMIEMQGTVNGGTRFSHEIMGEKFYNVYVDVKRDSGVIDTIPVQFSERMNCLEKLNDGVRVKIVGDIRTYNYKERPDSTSNKLLINAFAKIIEFVDDSHHDYNIVVLDGYIAKKERCRTTPLGRKITDVIFAVNRKYGKSAYIPCIYWGKNAEYVDSSLNVSTHIRQIGRFQSRTYHKQNSSEERIAYEVSISTFKVVDYENKGGNKDEENE